MAASATANRDSFESSLPSEREITLTRLFNAPRRLVCEAMTKPEHVRKWWGCLSEAHSVPVCEIDLRVGGKWRYVSRGPKGEVEFYGEYREVALPERIVFTEIFAPYPDVVSVVTATFVEEGAKTRMTVTALYPTKEIRDIVVGTGMEHGAGISYDRLEDLLETLQPS